MGDAEAPMEVEATTADGAASSGLTSKERTREEQIASLPWVEKYRPKEMSDLVSHEDIISTITRLIDAGKLPHLMLYGPPGTGKTSTILACAHKMYQKHFKSMVLELNASDERGIDVVRDQIKEFASTRQMFTTKPKLIILDEADAMTNPAQFALRRVIEKYTRNVRFCIICNYASKIIPALQSRCTRFRFQPLGFEQALGRLKVVADAENVVSTPEGASGCAQAPGANACCCWPGLGDPFPSHSRHVARALAQTAGSRSHPPHWSCCACAGLEACVTLGEGDMRKCINILQSTHMSIGEVSPTNVYVTTGCPMPHDIEAMLAWLLKEDFAGAFKEVWRLMSDKGLALQDVLTKVRLRRPGTRRSWSPPPISHIRRSPHVLRWARHTLAAPS